MSESVERSALAGDHDAVFGPDAEIAAARHHEAKAEKVLTRVLEAGEQAGGRIAHARAWARRGLSNPPPLT